MLSRLFAGIAITKLSRRLGFPTGAFIMIAVGLISFPSTVQFFEKYSSRFDPVRWQRSIVAAPAF
jgi:hypothetical protein